jgi:hypothetical protein
MERRALRSPQVIIPVVLIWPCVFVTFSVHDERRNGLLKAELRSRAMVWACRCWYWPGRAPCELSRFAAGPVSHFLGHGLGLIDRRQPVGALGSSALSGLAADLPPGASAAGNGVMP